MTPQAWLDRWALTPDGAAFATPTSHLVPVRWRGRAAMLKLALVPEEVSGNGLMAWWAGDGAAEVFAHDGPALLMARASGPTLLPMFRDGREAEGAAALTAAIAHLHRPRPHAPDAIAMSDRCASLFAATGAPFEDAAELARRLLADPRDTVILHGDAHPANFLDFDGAWLAIDPKGVRGERVFDYTHVFVTPDLPADPARLDRLLPLIAQGGGIDPARLLDWIAVAAALSAAWSVEDGEDPAHALAVTRWALSRRD